MSENAPSLRIVLTNAQPLDLTEYTKSLSALANEFSSFCKNNNIGLHEDTRLYIQEIKKGSIVCDLTAMIPIAYSLLPNILETARAIPLFF
ncbi:MAG: hypothetical protein LBP89_06950 [Helicobacteraceae bacterium]|nr:hypothetical protein [Helicobacteraceae bacterium]